MKHKNSKSDVQLYHTRLEFATAENNEEREI